MAHEGEGHPGPASRKSAIDAQICEAQKGSPQPENPRLEVTVLQAHNLPHLKTLSGKTRQFYVSVSDGTTTKKTKAIRGVEQAAKWNEKLNGFAPYPSSNITLRLYAKRDLQKDILLGTCLISQSDLAIIPRKDRSTPSKPAKLHLTLALSPDPSSSTTMAEDTPILITTEVDNGQTEGTSIPQSTLEFPISTITTPSEPLPPLAYPLRIESGTLTLPTGDDQGEMLSSKLALHDANYAVEMIKLDNAWGNVVERIKWVMDTVRPIAELHPYAKMAWGLFAMIPSVQRDENIQALLHGIYNAFDFTREADPLKGIIPHSKQGRILALMLQHACHCGDFIKSYAQDVQFWKRLLKNIGSRIDKEIQDLCMTFVELRMAFLDHATLTTELTVLQIFDDVGIMTAHINGILTQLEGMTTQLKWVSTQVLDLDLDEKLREIPYKGGWHSDTKREYLPGTRVEYMDYIVNWVDNPDSKRGLVLVGQAGTGKSSIAHEIARLFRGMNRLSSYFVFQRAERPKREDYLFFTTLVHDLSNRYPSFKIALGKVIRNNKHLRTANDYHTLFENVLLQSLKDLRIVGPILVIVDALDESGDATDRKGLHTFLAEHVSELPSTFRILITSRLESNIVDPFTKASKAFQIIRMDDSELSARTNEDIQVYLATVLPSNIYQKHGSALAKKAEGLFQWAAVACGYINDPPRGLTKNDCIRGLLGLSAPHEELGQKLGPLYDLYKQVLEGYFNANIVQRRFQSVMGQLLAAFEPLSIDSLTTLRQYSPDDDDDDDDSVIAIVGHLGSLLSNATSADRTLPITPLHTSFRDFLTDRKTSGDFNVDLDEAHRQLAHSCVGLMLRDLKFNICKLESSYLPNKGISDLQPRINEHIAPALLYSCRYWNDHLGRLWFEQDLFVKIQSLFEGKFLFWLEVLSLTNAVSIATPALLSLKAWLASDRNNDQASRNKSEEFQSVVTEASAFLQCFGMAIERSVPHIYVSALPFTPTSSHISKHYSSLFPNTLSVKRGRLLHWPAVEMVIPVERKSISVAFSSDGGRIVASSSDGAIRIWNATTGSMEGSLIGHTESVKSVAFSQDGHQIASCSNDCTIRVWNTITGKLQGSPFVGHTDLVNSVAFSPDGRRIVSGSFDCTIRVWKTATGSTERIFNGHIALVNSVAFSPDGQRIISGSFDCTIRVWNAMTGALEGSPITGHTDSVNSVAFSQDGRQIVSGSDDRTICIWNTTTGALERGPFIGHADSVYSVAFSPDGHRIVSGSSDNTIRVWDAMTGTLKGVPFAGHSHSINAVAFSPDGERIVSGSFDRTIRVWNAKTGSFKSEGSPFTGHTSSVNSVAFSQDGQRIVSGSYDRTIRVWDAMTGAMEGNPFTSHTGSVRSVAFSRDGKRIASGSNDCTIRVWNTATGSMEGNPFTGHTNFVNSLAFSHDGQRIVSGSFDHTIYVWNVMTGVMARSPLIGHTDSVRSVAFSQDGQWIASGSNDCTIRVWNATTGELQGSPFTGHIGSVNSVAFSHDGLWIVSGSADGTICVWNVTTGAMEGSPFTGHTCTVNSIAFSRDGQQIVSGSNDCTIRIWNTITGLEESLFAGHTDSVSSVAISHDGQHIVSASYDGTIRVWNVKRGTVVGSPTIPQAGLINSATSLRDSQELYTKNATAMDIAEQVAFNDETIINSEGWILGSEEELLVWIPPTHRLSLHRPSNIWVAGEHETRLDLSQFMHGLNWTTCHFNG